MLKGMMALTCFDLILRYWENCINIHLLSCDNYIRNLAQFRLCVNQKAVDEKTKVVQVIIVAQMHSSRLRLELVVD